MRIGGFATLLVVSLLRFLPILATLLLCGKRKPWWVPAGIVAGYSAAYVLLHWIFLDHWNIFSTASAILTQRITNQQVLYLPVSLLSGLIMAFILGALLGRNFRPSIRCRAAVLGISCVLGLSGLLLLDSSTADLQHLRINEISSNNWDSESIDYVELYNSSLFACDLRGLYLSDNRNNLTKKPLPEDVLPGDSYLLVRLGTSFSISDEGGEEILLSDSQGNILDSVVTGAVRSGYAYARCSDGTGSWAEITATPGKTNNKALAPNALLPVFSHPSGFYAGAFDLTITADSGCTIYYTLDGSVPTTSSNVYKGPIRVYDKSSEPNVFRSIQRVVPKWMNYAPSKTLVDKAYIIRAIAVSWDGSVSEPVTATYFVNLDKYQNRTVLSLVVDPDEMWGTDGIGVTGIEYDYWYQNGGRGSAPTTNFRRHGRQYEIEGALSYFCGAVQFDQQVGVRINGGSSRDGELKRLALYARTAYSGTEYFTESLLANTPNQSVVLRDEISNVINQMLMEDRNVAIQRATPVTLFLNGEYWYDTELIEKYDSNYFYQHYGVNPDNVVVCKKDELLEGLPSDATYQQQVHSFVKRNDMSLPKNYAHFCEMVDVQSYIDFIIANIYCDNMDFGDYKNVVVWRARTATDNGYSDGRWRFALYDMDAVAWNDHSYFGVPTQAEKNPFKLSFRFTEDLHDQIVYSNLIKNEEFRKQFVLTFQDLVNTVYTYSNVLSKFYYYTGTAPKSLYNNFFRDRPDYMTTYMAEAYGLTGTREELTLRTNLPEGGQIRLNTCTPNLFTGSWSGEYYTDYPVTVTAVPAEGYRFVGWEGMDTAEPTLEVFLQEGGVSIHAIFEKIS